MGNLLELFRKNKIGEPPWEYDFLVNLPVSEYPKYLAKIFNYRTGEKLPLKFDFKQQAWVIDKKKCKTFNQKIQWIKLYGVTDLMRKCTDKVAVRDYVAEKIGSEYLKPVLQICDSFDEIDFESLPKAFVLKCNHGSKWQYIIKDKEDVLNTKPVVDIMRRNMTGWLEQEYFPWNGFEMQYKEIKPKILIEPLLRDDINTPCVEIHVYSLGGIPKFIIKLHNKNEITVYDEKLNVIEDVFGFEEKNLNITSDNNINHMFVLSKQLAKYFNFVRVDWMLFQNKIYFEELTFTPYSGFHEFKNKKSEFKIGKLINIGENYEF